MQLGSIARIVVVTLLCTGPSPGAQQTDAAQVAAKICAACHGPRGVSVAPAFPRLAGQEQEYLAAQFKAFRDHSRADPMAQAFMWGMASQLSDEMIAKIAASYAAQKPAKVAVPVELVRAGETIFLQGMPTANVPACQTCHGRQAEGNAVIPRLAGQHVELVMFKSELRADASAPIMHGVSSGMTLDQMEAVAAYAASR